MLIPLGTDRPLRRRTVVTWVLLSISVAMFAAQIITRYSVRDGLGQGWSIGPIEARLALSRPGSQDVIPPGAAAPDAPVVHRWSGFRWYTLLTYAFLHGSWWHLAGNMLFLWVFGPNIEDRFGRLGFTAFYLLGGAVAGGLQILLEPHSIVVGASGAIAACTGAYLIMFPRAVVRAFSLLFVLGMVQLPAWFFIGLSIVWDLVAQSSGARTGVAHLAHLGGYGFGAAVAFALLGLKVLPREPYDVFTLTRQAYRRQQIKQAVGAGERANQRRWDQAKATSATSARASEQQARSDALAAARAEISRLMSAGDLPGAAAAYKRLAEQFDAREGGTTLSRRHQYDLAGHYFMTGDHAAAMYAYERFLETYPRDAEAPQIRLLLGRMNARYLNDPVRAKALITEAMAGLRDEASRDMARKELEALG